MSAVGRDEFERAVAAYSLDGVEVPDDVLAVGRASLDETGLFLVGELHGVEQVPRAVLALARRLSVDALAFEWSWDQFDPVVQPVLSAGGVDRDVLWSLPADAEAFSGDGRFTAGHVRVLDALAGELTSVVCADRLESATLQAREDDMAERLLAARRPRGRMIAVLGTGHVLRDRLRGIAPELDGVAPAGRLLAEALPGLANTLLEPSGGSAWSIGERPVEAPPGRFDVRLPLGPARPAVVPRPDAAAPVEKVPDTRA